LKIRFENVGGAREGRNGRREGRAWRRPGGGTGSAEGATGGGRMGRGGRFDDRKLKIFWDLKTISSNILSDFQGKFALKICFEKALKIIQKALNFKVCETEIKRYALHNGLGGLASLQRIPRHAPWPPRANWLSVRRSVRRRTAVRETSFGCVGMIRSGNNGLQFYYCLGTGGSLRSQYELQ